MSRSSLRETSRLARSTALLLALLACGVAACEEPDVPTRTVVLISIDTLRPERLGVYGNTPEVSPAIDALARDAVVYEQALAPAPWTLPSHMSMLTGLDPVAHGVETPLDKLSERIDTLAERLARQGFSTAAFTAGGFVGEGWGYEQGFELYDSSDGKPEDTGFSRYIDRAVGWIEEHKDKPYFLFLHTFDVHAPYDICDPAVLTQFRARPVKDDPRDYQLLRGKYSLYSQRMRVDQYGRLQELLNDYDAGVHEADAGVARVIDALKRTQRYDDAIVLVVSDHGEGMCDHGLCVGHGLQLTDNVLHVPLIAKFPGNRLAGRRVDELVDLIDVTPTVLDAVGLPSDPHVQGSSLRATARGHDRARDFVFGGTYTTATHFLVRDDFKLIGDSQIPPLHSVRAHLEPVMPPFLERFGLGEPFKTIDEHGAPSVTRYPNAADPLGYFESLPFLQRLFDRDDDPGEFHDLAQDEPKRAARMHKELQARFAESERLHAALVGDEPKRELTPAELRELRALGYTAGAEAPPPTDVDRHLAEARAHPPQPPPKNEVLVEIDRSVHLLRLALRDRGKLSDAELRRLPEYAERVAAWAEEVDMPHPNLRAVWRVFEIAIIAEQAGKPFDKVPLVLRILRQSDRSQRPGSL